MANETLSQPQDALQALLEVEVREAWFKDHPGAKEDGAAVGVLRSADGQETWMKTVGGVTTPIDRAEYNARLWWAQQQKKR